MAESSFHPAIKIPLTFLVISACLNNVSNGIEDCYCILKGLEERERKPLILFPLLAGAAFSGALIGQGTAQSLKEQDFDFKLLPPQAVIALNGFTAIQALLFYSASAPYRITAAAVAVMVLNNFLFS